MNTIDAIREWVKVNEDTIVTETGQYYTVILPYKLTAFLDTLTDTEPPIKQRV